MDHLKQAAMDRQKLTALLQPAAELQDRTPFCPENQLIAQYFDATLSERDHMRVQTHIGNCVYCQSLLGALARPSLSDSCIDEETLATAKQFADRPAPRKIRHAPIWMTAAMIVITLSVTTFRSVVKDGDEMVSSQTALPADVNTQQLRNIEQVSIKPQLLSPLEGVLVDPGNLLIRWTEIPGSLFYDIHIVSDDGALITRQRVWTTQWLLPADTRLEQGLEYFVRVHAFVSEGQALSSEYVVFKVGDRH